MNQFSCVLFDLDGTLIDTTPLILSSFRHTFLHHFNIYKKDEELMPFMGIPLRKPFEDLHPGMEDTLVETYRLFNEQRHDQCIGLFVNIVEMLEGLKERKILTGIVTSKRRRLAERGLHVFDLGKYFDVLVAAEDTLIHKPQGEPVLEALRRLKREAGDDVLYVGDSPYDILCAHNAGVQSAAVGWSCFFREELLQYRPDIELQYPSELLKYV